MTCRSAGSGSVSIDRDSEIHGIGQRRVHLSFDDGPDVEWTPRILDVLSQAGVHATFFMIGRSALAAPALVRRVVSEGHAIGNHTFAHRHPWALSTHAARREVRDGSAAIADVTGQSPTLFRPPFGRLRHCMIEEAYATGQAVILWNRSAVDWGPFGTLRGISNRLSDFQSGDIVLMHDGYGKRNKPNLLAQVLPGILRELAMGHIRCTLLTGSQMASEAC
jgi:peptidoglycan/xylan/chitin deacetylase (PgdA/CDA1 family)